MRDVLIDLLIWIRDRRPVSTKKDRNIWQRAHSLERVEIIAHVAFGRIYQDRAKSDDVVAGDQRAGPIVVKAEMPARMSGSVNSAQCDRRLAGQFQHLI